MKSGHKVTAYGTKRVKRERNKNENSAEEPRFTYRNHSIRMTVLG